MYLNMNNAIVRQHILQQNKRPNGKRVKLGKQNAVIIHLYFKLGTSTKRKAQNTIRIYHNEIFSLSNMTEK